MYFRFLIAVAILVALYVLLRWFQRTPPETVARVLRRAMWIGGIGLLLLLAATGRLSWLFALFASLLPLLRRLYPLLRFLPLIGQYLGRQRASRTARGGASPGRTSQIEARFVRMTLNHDTGELEGEVLEGHFQGRRLSELTQEQLVSLWRECRAADPESARLIQAYLDSVHGEGWHEQAGASSQTGASSGNGAMSREEAAEILGLSPDASRDEIIAAHRRLMQKLHPDRGGSTYLAAKINQAKDVLLGDGNTER
ncbi:MAG TPA: molecular chaperone DnaJ [Gammaproteobacteria bacterium]|nr:molecular chaperone DnaJ [Gammaproteobacteria bacterium]